MAWEGSESKKKSSFKEEKAQAIHKMTDFLLPKEEEDLLEDGKKEEMIQIAVRMPLSLNKAAKKKAQELGVPLATYIRIVLKKEVFKKGE